MPQPAKQYPRTTPIYSFAALKSKQREVKDRAEYEVVHLTENGNAAFILCSEEVFAQEKEKAAAEAVFEQELKKAITQGRKDIQEGRYVMGADATIARMHEIWSE